MKILLIFDVVNKEHSSVCNITIPSDDESFDSFVEVASKRFFAEMVSFGCTKIKVAFGNDLPEHQLIVDITGMPEHLIDLALKSAAIKIFGFCRAKHTVS